MKRTLAKIACILVVAAVCGGSERAAPQRELDIDRFAGNRRHQFDWDKPAMYRCAAIGQ